MILDDLANLQHYQCLHPLFCPAFKFLTDTDWNQLSDGSYELIGNDLYALVSHEQGRGREAAPLEYHRRYIDIQFVISGNEQIGWRAHHQCFQSLEPYDRVKDIGFFSDTPESWLKLCAGRFSIFFPFDAHAPLAGRGMVRKVVIKVACDE